MLKISTTVQSDWIGKVNILGDNSIIVRKKNYKNVCVIRSGYRDKAVRVCKYQSIVNGMWK